MVAQSPVQLGSVLNAVDTHHKHDYWTGQYLQCVHVSDMALFSVTHVVQVVNVIVHTVAYRHFDTGCRQQVNMALHS